MSGKVQVVTNVGGSVRAACGSKEERENEVEREAIHGVTLNFYGPLLRL